MPRLKLSAIYQSNLGLPGKRIIELFYSTFYLLEEAFHRVPFTDSFVTEVQSQFEQATVFLDG
jgi:hypothetical protein